MGQKKAKIALQQAQGAWEDTKDVLEEQEDLTTEAVELVDQKTEEEATLATKLKGLKDESKGIEDKMNALISFDKLKILVTATIIQMGQFMQEAVLDPLDGAGLQFGLPVEEWWWTAPKVEGEKEEAENKDVDPMAKARFFEDVQSNLKMTQDFCYKTAIPAFQRVPPNLQDDFMAMCAFQEADTWPLETTTDFASGVKSIGLEMIDNLYATLKWWGDEDDPKISEAEKQKKKDQLIALGEPAQLRTLKTAFQGSAYHDDYLVKWMVDGEFLKLYAQLKILKKKLDQKE